jgi:hypothetical protein
VRAQPRHLALTALLAAAASGAVQEPKDRPVDCPDGQRHVVTGNPLVPFACVKPEDEKKYGFDSVLGSKGYRQRPRCPRGTHPDFGKSEDGKPYSCVLVPPGVQDPEPTPVRPGKAPTVEPIGSPPPASSYRRFTIPRHLSFDYPVAFRVRDGWDEEVPTVTVTLDDAAAGKPVTIMVRRRAKGQAGWRDMDWAVARDKEWQGAKDGGAQVVAGGRARVTVVPHETRILYLGASKDVYYSFVYTAPAESYDAYLPAFSRLLKTLKLPERGR